MRVLIFFLIAPVTDWMAYGELCDRIYFKHPSEKTFPFVNILNGIYKRIDSQYEVFPVYEHMQAHVIFTYMSSDHSVGFLVRQGDASAPGLRCSLRITRIEIKTGRWMHHTNETSPFADIFSECYLTYGNSKKMKLNYTLTPFCMRNDTVACNGGDVFLLNRGKIVALHKKVKGKVVRIADRAIFEHYDPPKNTKLSYNVSTERWVIASLIGETFFFQYKTKYKDFALRPEFITSSWDVFFSSVSVSFTFFCSSQISECSRCKYGECQKVSIEYGADFQVKHYVYHTCSCYFGYKGKYCDKKSHGCAIPDGHEGLIVNTDRYSVASYFCGNLNDDSKPVFLPMTCGANFKWKINGNCKYFSSRKLFYVIVSTGSILLFLLSFLGLLLCLNVSRIASKWILMYSTTSSLYGFTWVCIQLWTHTSTVEHTHAVVLDSMGYFSVFLSVFINTLICEYPINLVKPMFLGGIGIASAMVIPRVLLDSNSGTISTVLFLVLLYFILLLEQYINIKKTRKYLDTLSEGVVRFCEDMAKVKPKLKVKVSSSRVPNNEEGLNGTFSEVIDVPIVSWKHRDKVYAFQEPAVWKVTENIVWSEDNSEERFQEYLFNLERNHYSHDDQSRCKFKLYTPGFKDRTFYSGNKSALPFSYWSFILVPICFLHWPLRYKYIICGLREKKVVIEKEVSDRDTLISTVINNPPPNYDEIAHTPITPPPRYEEATDFDRLLEHDNRPSYEEIMLQTRR
ncbi:uncharacterized protein LOC130633781 [Hydractinia symbiolongicarpus]|uniref:uncharacterized protein LOC130633781 n=1 Tax=Hydractinia symbiolongicarpus TaxID=13093 RepID=UPI0025506F80|nr:uncharacterized protein LOC130633781 [Hydractinia symbiolongicarpus]